MMMDAAVLLGDQASGVLREFRAFIQIHTAGEGVQPGFPAHPACLGGQGAADSFRRVDPSALAACKDLFKRRSCCFDERKYFSPASHIKISDKIHPFAGLGDAEIPAVKHLPLHTIPQSVQRMEDCRKRPPFVMGKQPGRGVPASASAHIPTGEMCSGSFHAGNPIHRRNSFAPTEVRRGAERPRRLCSGSKPVGAGQSLPEPAHAGEHIQISNRFRHHAPFRQ